MEEVDQIIFNSFSNIGCDFVNGLESLKQLTTENVVEASVKCLKIINPDIKMSHILPPGMSARFRVGSAIAQACQDVGYRGNIGYQTFLYSSEVDIRKIFMFLVEKLPRTEGVQEDQVSTSVLKKRIGQVLREQCAALWMPPYCTYRQTGKRFKTRNLHIPINSEESNNTPYIHAQLENHDELSPSVLELNISGLASQYAALALKESGVTKKVSKASFQWKKDAPTSAGDITMTSSFDDVVHSLAGSSNQAKQSRFAKAKKLQFTNTDDLFRKQLTGSFTNKPSIPKKPSHLKELAARNKTKDDNAIQTNNKDMSDKGDHAVTETEEETEEERFDREERELEQLLRDTEASQVEQQKDLITVQASIQQMKIELNEIENSMKDDNTKLDLKKKTVYLLPNADENMEKLRNLIDKNTQRLLNLGKMWEEKRIPLINQIRDLTEKCSVTEFDAEKKLDEIKELRKRMKEASEETKRKEEMIKQLEEELDSMQRDISRQSYTKRILEIVSSIHKQKAEIDRVIVDMKNSQKQMNQMKGRIERTFTAVDEVMFQDAKKDDNIRQAYKYLVALHDSCSNLVETVEETGAILREIRELEEQIDIETKKNAEDNLTKIMKDYKEMKKENADLMKKLKQG